ncbi:MAG: circularly permuted type 2 ATP-grasp protein [Hyphomicrobiales bacterium]
MSQEGAAPQVPSPKILSAYRPAAGTPDELIGADGAIRPVWKDFVKQLSAMSPDEVAQRIARGDQYLRDAGVFYRQYGAQDTAERDWPLSAMPVLISESEWQEIEAGLVERAELLEAVIADLYGGNRLVSGGHLPASLVAANPEWLRPLVGVEPRSGHFLHFVAFDIGRGPQGQWWVLGDRTQAPSGAGFALENRIATSRVYSDIYARSNVHRLAGFFRNFRDALQGLRDSERGRVGILTPGPLNDTYFEHAFIARYLGFTLLEGEDLVVRDGQLMVRTVAGLKPVSVLWRRLDANWADPLELAETSRIGTAGLVGAVRAGGVTMVNALGSGILETRALLAFMPRLAEVLTGRPLRMPNIATWWCGQPAERDYVKANVGRMTIGEALSTRMPFEDDDIHAVGGVYRGRDRGPIEAWLEAEGSHLVAQETMTCSTSPAFANGVLEPRPMSLRVFLARTQNGWQAMPGGFARVGGSSDSAMLSMQRGGFVADVWVVSERPVQAETMLHPRPAFVRSEHNVLPSRAADNLFWLGRYVERTENMVRLLRAYNVRLAEAYLTDSPLIALLEEHMEAFGIDPLQGIPKSVCEALNSAVGSAGRVRDRLSIDGWMALSDLAKTLRRLSEKVVPGDDAARAMNVILRKMAGFSGLVHENMYRFTGWRFLSIGRSLERATAMASILATFADDEAPEGAFDLAVEAGDSVMTHRRRYPVATHRATVIDLLALDPLNPRSILYQMTEMSEHIGYLPGNEPHEAMSDLRRVMMKAHTDLAVHTPDSLDTGALRAIGAEISDISVLLSATYLR